MSARRSPLAALASAAVLTLTLVASVAAKMPYFSVEVNPAQPIAGEPVTVTVRFWDDAEQRQPATWAPHEPTDDLLAFVPAGGTASNWVFVPLERVATSVMVGTVTLPHDGEWTLTPWPRTPELPAVAGYPAATTFHVEAPFNPVPGAAAGMLGMASVAALGLLLARRP
jgi:hypothetical protein